MSGSTDVCRETSHTVARAEQFCRTELMNADIQT